MFCSEPRRVPGTQWLFSKCLCLISARTDKRQGSGETDGGCNMRRRHERDTETHALCVLPRERGLWGLPEELSHRFRKPSTPGRGIPSGKLEQNMCLAFSCWIWGPAQQGWASKKRRSHFHHLSSYAGLRAGLAEKLPCISQKGFPTTS